MALNNTHYATSSKLPVSRILNSTSYVIASALVCNSVLKGQIFCYTRDGLFWWSFLVDGHLVNSIGYCSWQNMTDDIAAFCRRCHFLEPIWSKQS